jgi:hypothetical protein
VERVRRVDGALQIAEGDAGSRAAVGLDDLAGRHRIRIQAQHLDLVMI